MPEIRSCNFYPYMVQFVSLCRTMLLVCRLEENRIAGTFHRAPHISGEWNAHIFLSLLIPFHHLKALKGMDFLFSVSEMVIPISPWCWIFTLIWNCIQGRWKMTTDCTERDIFRGHKCVPSMQRSTPSARAGPIYSVFLFIGQWGLPTACKGFH